MTATETAAGRGTFIVIEGTDGSGKGTQFELLVKRLEQEGHDIVTFDFPQYEEPSSYFIKQYLNGKYGTAEEVGPYTGSLFYALNRYDASSEIKKALNSGKVVLANRYTGSNMAHQGGKFRHSEERRGYFIWLDNLEFEMLKIPRPDRSFVLRVPAEIAQELIDKKPERSYTQSKRDIHEADLEHLKNSVEVYDDLCQLFPKDFTRLDCVRNSKLLDPDTIHSMLWQSIEPMLPAKKVKAKTSEAQTANTRAVSGKISPYLEKTESGFKITSSGQDLLKDCVTDTTGNVYAFNNKLNPLTIAAAMARLSRRGDDMRVTILDEFAGTIGKDAKLLQRVITAYGDDSVQQLAGVHLVVEGASNILTKKLEWGRLASYLEQSTRYIYLDKKDDDGNYRFYVPTTLDTKTKKIYELAMNEIFDKYSDMVHKATDYVRSNDNTPKKNQDAAWFGATRAQACDAVRPVLPVATKLTVGIYASGQALESLIMHLLSDELSEARDTGQKILDQARKVIPTLLERADKPDRGGATIAYRANKHSQMKELARKYLSDSHGKPAEAVQLTSFWPRNEADLLADMLYEHSSLSLKELQAIVTSWPFGRKEEVFKAYIGERLNRRHRPGRAIEKAHYSWDILCDYGIFRDLQRHRMVDDLEWQNLTPRYGYETPKLIEDAGLTEQYEMCYELSLKLYSEMQSAGFETEAQYATLLGHLMRWKVTYNAREAFHLHELRTSPQGHPGYRKLVQQMHEKLAEVHPMLAEAMKFVNQGEDETLTRLAAERYTQFKLKQLG